MRRPSQRTIDLYNQLVAQQNKVRKQMIGIHKRAEETLGAGRLPSLVIPKASHKIKKSYFDVDRATLARRLREFWKKYNEAKTLFRGKSPINTYLARTLVDGYAELWREHIIQEDPEGYGGKYTDEQIMLGGNSTAMKIYNELFRRGRELFFLGLLNTGQIVSFQYIYQEAEAGNLDKENSWGYQQLLTAKRFLTSNGRLDPRQTKELYEVAGISEGEVKEYSSPYASEKAKSYSGKHTRKSEREAQRRKESAERG